MLLGDHVGFFEILGSQMILHMKMFIVKLLKQSGTETKYIHKYSTKVVSEFDCLKDFRSYAIPE